MRLDSKARIVGSVGVITAYFCILHVSVIVGVIINFIADLISIPYFVRTKSWDVVIMLSFLLVISMSKADHFGNCPLEWHSTPKPCILHTSTGHHPMQLLTSATQVDYYPVTPAGKRFVRRVTWHPGADTEMTTFSTIVKSEMMYDANSAHC